MSVHAVVYNHVWVLDVLERCGLVADDDIVVEVEPQSSLIELVKRPSDDVRILLRGDSIDTAVVRTHRMPAALVLAPLAPTGALACSSAYSLAAQGIEGFDRTVLLIPVTAVPTFAHLLRAVSRVRVLWDVAEPVGRSLDALAGILLDEALFDPETWDGVQLYRHPSRPDVPDRRESLQRVFADHPDLVRPAVTLESP